jgi:plastocyanin
MRVCSIGIVLAIYVVASACGPASQPVSNPTTPTPLTTSHIVTIDIAEVNGPYSFYPSPAAITRDQVVVWRNWDTVTHHLVFDDGSIDTGTLAPDTLSQPMTIGAAGNRSYHCTIHPTMVGTVVMTSSLE